MIQACQLEVNIPLSFYLFCERKKIDFFKPAIFSVLFCFRLKLVVTIELGWNIMCTKWMELGCIP